MNRETNNLVLHDQKIVLMTACKAGNTSIKQALHDADLVTDRSRGLYFGFEHWSAEQCANSPYHRIAILRHPVARLVSTWHAKLIAGDTQGKTTDIVKRHGDTIRMGMSLTDFVEAVLQIPDTSADPHLRSQCFDRFHRGLYLPKMVFKIEAPSESWWPKLREFIPELPDQMPHENKSDAPDWEKCLSADDLRRISIRYQADLLLGSYPLR